MRILITSTDHQYYNETGVVVSDKREEGVEVKLDRSGEVVLVPAGQFKVTKIQP